MFTLGGVILKKKIFVLVILGLLLISGVAFANVNVTYNGEPIHFNDDYGYPYVNENWHTMMPVNIVLSTMGVEVAWLPEEYAVDLRRDDIHVYVPINENYVVRNGEVLYNESTTIIKNGRTYLPLRLVLEAFGAEVGWIQDSRTVTIEDAEIKKTTNLILGARYEDLKDTFGLPDRIDQSEYNFDWYVYNKDLTKLTYIGYNEYNVVKGIYTQDENLELNLDIGIGSSRSNVLASYSPLEYILKGNTRYYYDNIYGNNVILVKDSGRFIRFFMDTYTDEVIGVMIIAEDTEKALNAFRSEEMPGLKESYLNQIFDLTNSMRAKEGLPLLSYNKAIEAVSEAHSEDMMSKNYFSHVSLNGDTLGDRLNAGDIDYKFASENIATGQQSSIFAVVGWMNSEGHRKNILTEKLTDIGVGVAFGGTYGIYYTQNFIY